LTDTVQQYLATDRSEAGTVTTAHLAAGRPRDPGVDRRIAHAALDLFGEAGWAGFAIEAVARRAGVGKASVYLRWSTKEALLTDAVRMRMSRVTDVDTGTLRGDLTGLAIQMLDLYAGPSSQAALRLSLEADAIPGVAKHHESMRRSHVLAARAIVRRGIERGEAAPDTPVTLLLDTLTGGAMMHALNTPPDRKASLQRNLSTHAERLVSFLLRAVGSQPGAGGLDRPVHGCLLSGARWVSRPEVRRLGGGGPG
jgi:AcrR family transcriptional regulator